MPPADQEAVRQTVRDRSALSWRITLALKAYATAGLITAIIAMGYLVFRQIGVKLDAASQFALIGVVTGFTIAVLSWALLVMRRELHQRRVDRLNEYLRIGRFIQAWAAFEEAARAFTRADKEQQNVSVRSVLEGLKAERILQPTDLIRVEELLQLRNALVHTGADIPREEIDNAYRLLLHYLKVLERVHPEKSVA